MATAYIESITRNDFVFNFTECQFILIVVDFLNAKK